MTEQPADGQEGTFRAYLKARGARLVRCQEFQEEYFRPRRAGPDWADWSRILKLGQDRESRTKVDLICCDLAYEFAAVDGERLQRVTTQFLFSDGPLVFSELKARRLLDRLDHESLLKLSWTIDTLSVPLGRGRTLQLAVGRTSSRPDALTVKVAGGAASLEAALRLLRSFDGAWAPLCQPVWQWVTKGAGRP